MRARWRSFVHAPVVALLLLAIGTTTRAGVLGLAARELSERLAVPAREAAGKFARAPKPLGIHHGGDPVRLLHRPGAAVRPPAAKLRPGAARAAPVLGPRSARRLAIPAEGGLPARIGRTRTVAERLAEARRGATSVITRPVSDSIEATPGRLIRKAAWVGATSLALWAAMSLARSARIRDHRTTTAPVQAPSATTRRVSPGGPGPVVRTAGGSTAGPGLDRTGGQHHGPMPFQLPPGHRAEPVAAGRGRA
jgi:hypothetical protein